MSKHPPWVTLLFVKCVTHKSTTADCILMKLGIMMHYQHFIPNHHYSSYYWLDSDRRTHLTISLQLRQNDKDKYLLKYHLNTEAEDHQTASVDSSRTKTFKAQMSAALLITWLFREHPWNGLSNSGIWRCKQTRRCIIKDLIKSSAWLEEGDGETGGREHYSRYLLG